MPGYSLTAPVCLSVSVTFSLCKHKCTEKRECVHGIHVGGGQCAVTLSRLHALLARIHGQGIAKKPSKPGSLTRRGRPSGVRRPV